MDRGRCLGVLLMAIVLPSSSVGAQEKDFFVGNLGDGDVSIALPGRTVPDSELDPVERGLRQEKQSRIRTGSEPRAVLGERTTATLMEAATLSKGTIVKVVVHLVAPKFDFSRLAGLDDVSRAGLVGERKRAFSASEQAVRSLVASLDARVIETYWSGEPAMLVQVPSDALPRLAALAAVRGLEFDRIGGEVSVPYHLRYVASYTNVRALRDNGYDGTTGHGTGAGPIRIAFIEHGGVSGGCFDNNIKPHPAFSDSGCCSPRISAVYNCSSGSCASRPSGGGYLMLDHGQLVTGTAVQDLMDNQDPAFSEKERDKRTGMAPEARIYYYYIGCSTAAVRAALDQAVSDGADIINMSFGFDVCHPGADGSGVNGALAAARSAGALPVAATGNASNTSGGVDYLDDVCEISWPASRPDVIAATGLLSCDETVWDLDVGAGISSMGGINVSTIGGYYSTAAGVDLAAPGCQRFAVREGSGYETNQYAGSSIATPTIAGAAADLRNALWTSAGRSVRGGELLVMMLLMGDGSNGRHFGTPAYGFDQTMPNRRSGYGRMKMWWPASLTAPAGWGTHIVTIHQGETIAFSVGGSGPESSSITEWKWAVTWFDNQLAYLSDIDVSVYNTCPAGGGPAQYITGQNDGDFRNRIRLTTAEISGRCLEMRLYGYSVRPEGVEVYSADMFHSGPGPT